MRWIVLAFVLVATNAVAKPLGTFELDAPESAPGQFSFSLTPDWHSQSHYQRLAQHSARTGHRWVVCLCADAVITEDSVRASLGRLTPILPYVVAVMAGEEHYEAALSTIEPSDNAGALETVFRVREAAERSHAAIQAVVGWPIVWLTTVANDDPRYGPWWYRPVPSGTAVIGLDAYVYRGTTFAQSAEPVIRHAVNTSRLPIALIWQTFEAHDWAPVSAEAIAGYGRWARHQKVLASWVFTWDSRPGLVGLKDLPQWHGAVLEAIR